MIAFNFHERSSVPFFFRAPYSCVMPHQIFASFLIFTVLENPLITSAAAQVSMSQNLDGVFWILGASGFFSFENANSVEVQMFARKSLLGLLPFFAQG